MLYQQGTQRIEIIVRKDSTGDSGAKEIKADEIGGGSEKNSGGWAEILTGSSSKRRQYRVFKTNTTHAIAVTKQITDLSIQHVIGGIGLRHGDQSLQDHIQRTMEKAKDTTSLASSVAMGAVYGSWGGPIGTVLGATFGLATTAASLGAKYAGRQREFNFKVFKENNSIEYRRARASINLTTGRLR